MAIVEVKVPQLSESVAEATMLTWKRCFVLSEGFPALLGQDKTLELGEGTVNQRLLLFLVQVRVAHGR